VSKESEERLLKLVIRELGASDAKIVPPGGIVAAANNIVVAQLESRATLVAVFERAPDHADALARKLALIASTFSESARDGAEAPVAPRSLREELRVLAKRAMAVDAVVIDTQSPVIWGAAFLELAHKRDAELSDMSRSMLTNSRDRGAQDWDASGLLPELEGDGPSLSFDEDASSSATNDSVSPEAQKALRALQKSHGQDHGENHLDHMHVASSFGPLVYDRIDAVRSLPENQTRSSGKNWVHYQPEQFAVHAFGIYLLVVIFEGPFEELRTRRVVSESLPRIEGLVLALPPEEPEPPGATPNVIAMRRRKR
jgi:hypothetical protein